jgi:Asp-tRNA(Asn)/Glu-tRNA(Gln) amidotransferase C subunit
MSVDQATVKRVARLARIKVNDEDLPRLAGELNAILGWIEQLNDRRCLERRTADLGRQHEDEDAQGRGH